MGSGIAQIVALAGFNTIQFDVNEKMLANSKSLIQKNLQKSVEKNKINENEKSETLNRIIFTNQINECLADVIIEAIIEDIDAKISLFNNLAAINNSQTIFASNTSSISVSAIAAKTKYSANVIGMHFFNPAPVMKLVEVVRSIQTDEKIVQQIFELAKQLNKIPVVCNDAPGFIVNRIARQYYLESLKLLESRYTDFETIDKMMEATGFKMGPFKLMDLIGIDINFSVSNIIWEQLGKPERLMPSALQQQKFNEGNLGRKTGKGFYNY